MSSLNIGLLILPSMLAQVLWLVLTDAYNTCLPMVFSHRGPGWTRQLYERWEHDLDLWPTRTIQKSTSCTESPSCGSPSCCTPFLLYSWFIRLLILPILSAWLESALIILKSKFINELMSRACGLYLDRLVVPIGRWNLPCPAWPLVSVGRSPGPESPAVCVEPLWHTTVLRMGLIGLLLPFIRR